MMKEKGNAEKAKVVSDTADKLGVDQSTKSAAVMSAYLGPDGETVTRILGAGLNVKLTAEAEAQNPKSGETPDYNEIEGVIAAMLTKGTGAHFLDSGGAYGRHWQKNRQVPDFRDRPELSIDIWNSRRSGLQVTYSIDVFHYLTAFLEIDSESAEYERRLGEIIQGGESGYAAMHRLAEALEEQGKIQGSHSFNTYNHESMLSQNLQGIWLYEGKGPHGETYLILQVHNGADVRGGYTRPKVFYVPAAEYMMIAQQNINASCECGSIYSDCCGHHWNQGSDLEPDGDRLPKVWVPNEVETHLICEECGEAVKFAASLCW